MPEKLLAVSGARLVRGAFRVSWPELNDEHYCLFHSETLESHPFKVTRVKCFGDTDTAHKIFMGLVDINQDTALPK